MTLGAAALFWTNCDARANLITNGDFENESPAVSSGGFINVAPGNSTTITGWTVFGAGDVSAVSTTFTQNGLDFVAESGLVWIDLTGQNSNGAEGLQQTVSTTLGDQYSLTFYVGNVDDPGGIFGTTSTVGVQINGTQVTSCENSDSDSIAQAGLEWNLCAYNFIGDGSPTTIGFENLDPANDNSNGLDNVVLLDNGPASQPVTSSPEPGTLVLFGAGLAGLGAIRRRKRT